MADARALVLLLPNVVERGVEVGGMGSGTFTLLVLENCLSKIVDFTLHGHLVASDRLPETWMGDHPGARHRP